jgi:peptide/nickel transport system ATP-binding protein
MDEIRLARDSRIYFQEEDLLRLSERHMHRLRGSEIAMVFQDAGPCLNPLLRVGEQIAEPLMRHLGLSRREAQIRTEQLLNEVGMASPALQARAYPHQLSGGEQQRVMIAMAISCKPKLLIADEPTSALDVTIQKQILELLARLQRDYSLSVLLITHDLGIVADIADHVVVMQRGEIKEQGAKSRVLFSPQNAYTRALLASRLRLNGRREDSAPRRDKQEKQTSESVGTVRRERVRQIVLEGRNLSKNYSVSRGFRRAHDVQAVKDVSFTLGKCETLGLVGESGSGKTTLAMMILHLVKATAGTVYLFGEDVSRFPSARFRPLRRRIQVVFQNPYASLNPRWTVRQTLIEPMKLHGIGKTAHEREDRAAHLLERVGLQRKALYKYPHQFSGGERQRIAIARCLSVEPEILICDECVSALDVSVQVQLLDLLRDLQDDFGVSYLFISHDLSVIKYISDRVLVMRNGEIVESGDTESVVSSPTHPYTRELFSAIPGLGTVM